jgi:nucleotide-binding universal stress UspA family protein
MTSDPNHPILVCYDGSENAHETLGFTASAFPGRRVLVLTAWEPLLIFGAYPMMDVAVLDDAARKMAANGAARARELGLDATWTTAEASRGLAGAIIDVAGSHQVPLIVMGSRGDGEQFLHVHRLGSVARAVAHSSDRPLMIVPSSRSKGHRQVGDRAAEIAPQLPLLLCCDRSSGARHAIEVTAELFPGRKTVVLHVWSPIGMAAPARGGALSVPLCNHVALQRAAEELAAEGCRRASEAGLDATPEAVEMDFNGICHAILAAGDRHDAGLIVAGARGLSALESLVLGSVSHGIAQQAHRPVLIVPARSSAEEGGKPPESVTSTVDSPV